MTDYLQAVFAMLGPGARRLADPAAWLRLEEGLGRSLPEDYKRIIDTHAPVQINGHLTLSHPASGRFNLGEDMRSMSATWAQSAWESHVTGPDDDPRVFCSLPHLGFGTAGDFYFGKLFVPGYFRIRTNALEIPAGQLGGEIFAGAFDGNWREGNLQEYLLARFSLKTK